MFGLDDYRWLVSDEGRRAWEMFLAQNAQSDHRALPNTLRTHDRCTAHQSRLLLEQRRLALGPARRKFADPSQWFWTSQLVEQASDEFTAAETAKDFPSHSLIVDACCGAGSDAVALAKSTNRVTAVDQDSIACTLTRANSDSHGVPLRCISSPIEQLPADSEYYLHIDPDRRSHTSRTIHLDRMSPSWNQIAGWIGNYRGVSLKLAPGSRMPSEIPFGKSGPPSAMRWLSRDGSVRQQRWYWNIDRWPSNHRIVSVEQKNGSWHHEAFPSINAQESNRALDARDALSNYIADQDPGLRAAECCNRLADGLGIQCVGNAMGYYHADRIVMHPFLRWFRVFDVLPADRKKLRAYTREHPVRSWELKSRNVDVDLDALRKDLIVNQDAEAQRTLLMTRIGERYVAIIAEPIHPHEIHRQ